MRTLAVVIGLLIALVGRPPAALAQAEPPVGVRAAGMGGAFVGVADDASAVYWNPAGLASGAFFGLVLDRSSFKTGDGDNAPDSSALLLAAGSPPLGATYYRLAFPVAATGTGAGDRNTVGFTLVTNQFGVTLDQSLRDGLAVGVTVKGVHATTEVGSRTALDADIGLMFSGSVGRAGVAVRNAFEPDFTTPIGIVRLQRRVRAGGSLLLRQMVRVAGDVDITTADTPLGPWRDAAVGAEAHPLTRAWMRGGVHWNTAGGALRNAPILSVGGSGVVYGSLMVDAQVSFGSENGNRGWGAGLRYNF